MTDNEYAEIDLSEYEEWLNDNVADAAETVSIPVRDTDSVQYEDVPLDVVKDVCNTFLKLVGLSSYQQIQRQHLYEMIVAAYMQGYGAAANDIKENPSLLEEVNTEEKPDDN